MPPFLVLIICKTVLLPYQTPLNAYNAEWTGHENRTWKIEHGKMQCRRKVVQVFDQSEAQGADPQPFNTFRCNMAGIMSGVGHDMTHKSSSYRYWRSACPVPSVDTRTGKVLDWKLPECGKRESVVCESESEV